MKQDASALILAGGKSIRMGADKALLAIENEPLIARTARSLCEVFDEVMVSANHPGKFAFLNLPVIEDTMPDAGPMAGVIAALSVARHDRVAVLACDILAPDMSLLMELLACCPPARAAAPVCDGHLQPLFAVYTRALLPEMEEAIRAGNGALHSILRACNARLLAIDSGRIRSFNTPREFLAVSAALEASNG